jgi:nucleotide-binding universal stress UspA family protein
MYRRILFPTDGSAASTRAAKTAIGLAQACGAQLVALHVIEPFMPTTYADAIVPYPELYSADEYERITQKSAQRMLAKVQARAGAANIGCEIEVVTAAPVWKAIIAAARRKRCDAIVMASHGRHGLEGLVLGSEAHKVLTHGKTPVLVCR